MLVVSLSHGLQQKCLKVTLLLMAFPYIDAIVRNAKAVVFVSMSKTAYNLAFTMLVMTLKYFGLKFISVVTVFTLPLVINHLPNPKYNSVDFVAQLSTIIESIIDSDTCPEFLITGDFNTLCTDFLEEDFGFNQLVCVNTHGN